MGVDQRIFLGSARSRTRRMASGRPGWSACSPIQWSSRWICAGKSRTSTGVAWVGGRPLFRFFSILPI